MKDFMKDSTIFLMILVMHNGLRFCGKVGSLLPFLINLTIHFFILSGISAFFRHFLMIHISVGIITSMAFFNMFTEIPSGSKPLEFFIFFTIFLILFSVTITSPKGSSESSKVSHSISYSISLSTDCIV